MEKLGRGILLFLVLMLVLSAGISYLAFNQASKGKNNDETKKMAVALVNEDQGAEFNGKHFEFGDEFIKRIEKDNKHDWYVVSRGVAENGLKRKSYNMMIVIPSNFTEKALSINSTIPEKVTLNYKINSSGNNNMKAEAEKTASSILADFNRRIIDVYFASVLGNLQDAQDNIGKLVNKELAYTSIYKKDIHNPLSNYTSQFKQVQDSTKLSKESFKGLQDLLKSFGNNLNEGFKTNQLFQTEFGNIILTNKANGLLAKNFSNELGLFNSSLNSDNVMQQLQNLESANKAINELFQKNEETSIMFSKATAIKNYLTSTKAELGQIDTKLDETLPSDMEALKRSIIAKLKKQMQTPSGEEQNVNLSKIFDGPDKSVTEHLKKQITKLPSLNPEDMDPLDLDDSTKTQLKNIMALTHKYIKEFDVQASPSGSIPTKQMNEDLEKLKKEGMTLTDTVQLPETKKSGQELTITPPKGFEIDSVKLTLPHIGEGTYTRPFIENGKIVLPATGEGDFTIKLHVVLKNASDITKQLTWNWELNQKDVTNVDQPESPSALRKSSVQSEEGSLRQTNTVQEEAEQTDTESLNEQKEDSDQKENGTSDEESTNQSTNKEKRSNTDNDKTDPKETPDTGEQNKEKPQPDQNDQPGEKVVVENNYIKHIVTSPLPVDMTSDLINVISEYRKMAALFDVYFETNQLENTDISSPDYQNKLNEKRLDEWAGENSLYSLFNKQNIIDVLTNYIADQITEDVHGEAEELKGKIDTYIQQVDQANENSNQLIEMINRTSEQAELLNNSLAQTLQNLMSWREQSLKLQDEHTKILTNKEQEQSDIIALDDQFSSLLAESQSLADQSKSNLNSADSVYETFDSINSQAKAIKDSGSTLVTKADELSNDWTNKVKEDKNFANNFASVFANSRIGERPNDYLLNFLSNPVQTKNEGVIVEKGDTFTPYFIVLICFIVSLFTAYVISTNERKRIQQDMFEEERSFIRSNVPITMITTGIGIVEGIVIGLLSGYLLEINQEKFMFWIGLITAIVLSMVLVATYLLRQLKMIGMFVLLIVLSLYLFFTQALGLHFDKSSLAADIKTYSPLQYVEKLLIQFGDGTADLVFYISSLLVIVVIGFACNLFVFKRSERAEEIVDEGINEAH